MSNITNMYPSLAEVVNFDALPKQLDFLTDFLNQVGGKLYLKNLQMGQSSDNVLGSYRAALVTYGDLDFPIYGDLAFVIAPPDTDDFILRFDYKWELLKYINRFSLDIGGSTPGEIIIDSLQEVLEIIIELSGRSPQSILRNVLRIFIEDFPEGLSDFYSAYNSKYGTSHVSIEDPEASPQRKNDDVISIITDDDKSMVEVVYDLFINTGVDSEEKLEKLKSLFKSLFEDVSDSIEEIIAPHFEFNIQLPSVGIRFPDTWLKPVDEDGEELPDSLAYLTCDNIGGISYTSGIGFYFDLYNDVTYSLPLCKIGNTGLILSVTELKLDLRDDQNIPEADADGRSNKFKGLFVKDGSISFPNFFNPSADNTASIVARNLLIGSEGGLSGTIGIQTVEENLKYLNFVPTVELDEFSGEVIGYSGFNFNLGLKEITISGHKKIYDEEDLPADEPLEIIFYVPADGIIVIDAENNYYSISNEGEVLAVTPPAIGILQFTLFDTTVTINDFYLTFSKNKVVSSTVTGTIEFDALDEPLNMEIDFTDGFQIHVSYPPGLNVMDNSVFTLTLNDLKLGRINEKLFVALSAKLTNNLEIPYVNKFVPSLINAHNLRWSQGEGFDYNLTLEWANGLKLGISNDGPPALEPSKFRLPFNQNKDGGLFKLDAIDLSLAPVEDGVTVGVELVGAVFNLKDIVVLTVDGLGAKVALTKVEEDGNVGPFNAVFGLIPPKGIGLKVDAKAVTGGGYVFLDFEKGRYVGVAELTIKDKISLKVIGIITTKLPSGEKGNSVLLLVTAEFSPINLSFGFTLNGVGGLVGINRDMNLQALRDGVKSNAIDNIMFPDDPVGNISQIVSDLETIFPIQEGRYTFGIMGLIGWGTPTLITIELGLMLSVPKPVRLAILGVVKCILPTEDNDLLKLQINFLGTIDFEAKFITFDASIYESNFLTFSLSGDMAFRLKWGDEPNFLFSVGGFHPSFTPPPLNLPTMDRLMINFLAEENPRLTLSTYIAVTSNTVQFGALLDFYYKITDNIQVVGALGFDILIQFSPFYLRAELYAMLAVLYKNNAVISVSLYGMLEGPKPWHVQGKAEFVFLKMNFKANFDKTFGDEGNTTLPDINVMPLLEDAANKSANWQGVFPTESNLSVSLKEQVDNGEEIILTHPNGSLRFEQKIVPLNMSINKFGKQTPVDYRHFSMEMIDFTTNSTKEFFAPAEFVQLSDNEKLSRKSFEKMDSGITVTNSKRYQSSDYLTKKVQYEQIVYDSTEFGEKMDGLVALNAQNFQSWVNNNSTANSNLGSKKKTASNFAPNKMKIASETFTIAKLEDLTAFAEIEGDLTFGSEVEARIALDNLFTNNPELIDQLDVVLEHELV